MILRLRNVKISIFNPEVKRWIESSNMTVLATQDYIYCVKSEAFNSVVMEKLNENEDYLKCTVEANKTKMYERCFNELLEQCPITERLQGGIYSRNILWKVER